MHNERVLRATFITLFSFLAVACSSEPREYDFAVSVAGGPQGWPVWVEDITFDGTWNAAKEWVDRSNRQEAGGGPSKTR